MRRMKLSLWFFSFISFRFSELRTSTEDRTGWRSRRTDAVYKISPGEELKDMFVQLF